MIKKVEMNICNGWAIIDRQGAVDSQTPHVLVFAIVSH